MGETAVVESIQGTKLRADSLSVYMDTTNRCNLRCRMCYFSYDTIFKRPAIHMPIEKFEKIAHQVFPYAHTVFLSASSEPLQHPQFGEIVRIASQYGLKNLKFLTNGQQLDSEIAKRCVDSRVTEIHVSVDGANAATYEWIRRGASFERLIRNLEALTRIKRESGSPTPILQFNITLMRRNADQLGELARLAQKVSAERLAVRHMVSYAELGMEEESLFNCQSWANERLHKGLEAIAEEGVSVVVYPELFSGESANVPPWSGWTEKPATMPSGRFKIAAFRRLCKGAGRTIDTLERRFWRWPLERTRWEERFARVVRQPMDRGAHPFGRVDIPEENAFVLRDGMECAGWALHKAGVDKILAYREPLNGDSAHEINSLGLISLGEATRHVGSRPDVAAAHPGYLDSNCSGWTFRLFDRTLPKTKDAISLHFVARGRDGQHAVIGSRRVERDEHSADALPFCSRPFTCLYIDPLGNTFPHPDCQIPDPFGTFDQNSPFEEIWQGSKFVELRRQVLEVNPPSMCRACPDFINRHVDDPAYFADRYTPH